MEVTQILSFLLKVISKKKCLNHKNTIDEHVELQHAGALYKTWDFYMLWWSIQVLSEEFWFDESRLFKPMRIVWLKLNFLNPRRYRLFTLAMHTKAIYEQLRADAHVLCSYSSTSGGWSLSDGDASPLHIHIWSLV